MKKSIRMTHIVELLWAHAELREVYQNSRRVSTGFYAARNYLIALIYADAAAVY